MSDDWGDTSESVEEAFEDNVRNNGAGVFVVPPPAGPAIAATTETPATPSRFTFNKKKLVQFWKDLWLWEPNFYGEVGTKKDRFFYMLGVLYHSQLVRDTAFERLLRRCAEKLRLRFGLTVDLGHFLSARYRSYESSFWFEVLGDLYCTADDGRLDFTLSLAQRSNIHAVINYLSDAFADVVLPSMSFAEIELAMVNLPVTVQEYVFTDGYGFHVVRSRAPQQLLDWSEV